MAKHIYYGREMIRINPANNHIEYSTNGGRTWLRRLSFSIAGTFYDLLEREGEILAATSKGVFYSTNGGRSWSSRCRSTAYGTFENLMDAGTEIMAQTSRGLYASRDNGRSWRRKS